MNDNFSFDGAAAADMPLDLSSSSMPEVEAATGFHGAGTGEGGFSKAG